MSSNREKLLDSNPSSKVSMTESPEKNITRSFWKKYFMELLFLPTSLSDTQKSYFSFSVKFMKLLDWL
jgi:hypothetical protein